MGNIARKQKLTRETIRAIMQRTKFDEVTVLEMHDEFHRLNPSGKMKLVKMFHIYEEFFPTKNYKQLCRHIFRVLDRDQNGFVDFTEFIISLSILFRGTLEEQIQWAFELYDIDGNGMVDPGETVAVMTAILDLVNPGNLDISLGSGRAARRMARSMFTAIDTNRDGLVSLDEFRHTCTYNNNIRGLLFPL